MTDEINKADLVDQLAQHRTDNAEERDLFNITEIDRAPKWDGHTANDVERLMHVSKS